MYNAGAVVGNMEVVELAIGTPLQQVLKLVVLVGHKSDAAEPDLDQD
jgi:hypothetical protein